MTLTDWIGLCGVLVSVASIVCSAWVAVRVINKQEKQHQERMRILEMKHVDQVLLHGYRYKNSSDQELDKRKESLPLYPKLINSAYGREVTNPYSRW